MDEARFKWLIKAIDFDTITDWEEKFIESLENQFIKKKFLTEKQLAILEKIYEERQ